MDGWGQRCFHSATQDTGEVRPTFAANLRDAGREVRRYSCPESRETGWPASPLAATFMANMHVCAPAHDVCRRSYQVNGPVSTTNETNKGVIEPPTTEDFALAGDLARVALPVALVGDEKGGMARIAERGLNHQVLAEPLAHPAQLFIAVHHGENVGHVGALELGTFTVL